MGLDASDVLFLDQGSGCTVIHFTVINYVKMYT